MIHEPADVPQNSFAVRTLIEPSIGFIFIRSTEWNILCGRTKKDEQFLHKALRQWSRSTEHVEAQEEASLNMLGKTKRETRNKGQAGEEERKVEGTKSARSIESSLLSDVVRGGRFGCAGVRGWFASKCICRNPTIFRSVLNGRTCAEFGRGCGHYSPRRHNPVAFRIRPRHRERILMLVRQRSPEYNAARTK